MRTVPAAITAARQASSSRLCKIWRIERLDGLVLRFTEHDRDIDFGGEVYQSTASFDPSAIKSSADLSVGDLSVEGAFDDDLISPRDVLAGLYNGATFTVSELLWDDPGAGDDVLKFGWLGNIKETGGRFVAELLDPTRIINRPVLRLYTPGCSATLGDARCGVDLEPFTQSGTVSAVTTNRVFTVSGLTLPSGDDAYFEFGLLTFTGTGVENDGLSMEVKSFDGSTIELMLAMPFDVTPGDTFSIVAGCNKSLGACRFKFANVPNYRGFPHAPVSDSLLKGITPTDGPEGGGGVIEPAPDDGSLSA